MKNFLLLICLCVFSNMQAQFPTSVYLTEYVSGIERITEITHANDQRLFVCTQLGIIHIVGTLLTANGNLMAMNIVFVVGIVINSCSNYFLILEYGAWGAAISTIITQSFVALAELELARRVFSVSFSGLFLFQVLIFVLGVGGINWGLQALTMPWFLSFVLAGVLSVIWALITKIIDVRSILRIIKTKAT